MSTDPVHMWNGREETDWMMPIRAHLDGLPLDPAQITALHALVDLVYRRAHTDSETEAGEMRALRDALQGRGRL